MASIEERVIDIVAEQLGVEKDNPLARDLYERLGYEVYGQDTESWEKLDDNGQAYTHHAEIDLLKKELQ